MLNQFIRGFRKMPVSKKIFWIIAIIIAIGATYYLVSQGGGYFTRRSVFQFRRFIRSYGSVSPFIVLALIVASTAIPPLPLPIPLIEIAAGLLYGFGPGFFIILISQIVASLTAFYLTKLVKNSILKKFLNNRVFNFYKRYIHDKGPTAVFITKATMSAPFNVVSFLAGLTQMSAWQFFIAIFFGSIPEAAIYAFTGSIFRQARLSLWYVFILTVILGAIGPALTYMIVRSQKSQKKIR